MIQRVQSIYLVLAVIAGLLTFFLPFTHFYAGDLKIAEYAMFGVFNVQSDTLELTNPFPLPMWSMSVLAILMPLIALFQFKKRLVQIKIVRLGFLIEMAFLVYLFFAIDKINAELYEGQIRLLYHTGFYMPLIAIVLLFLAQRGIKKDEDLVKSLDRLR